MITNNQEVIVTYYVETDEDLKSVAERIAFEETTGGWSISSETTELLKDATGKVVDIDEIAKGKGIIRLSFPGINMNLKDAVYPSLWMFMAGGPVFELSCYKKIRLLDFDVSSDILTRFPGPKFGIKGTRKLLGISQDEPIMGTIIKPCAGLTPEQVARKCHQAAMAGLSFIKDDEKMNNPDYCPLDKRVRLVMSALKDVFEKTGKKTLYAVNITTRTDRVMDNAKIAQENGANALMLNMFASGFSAIEILSEEKSINLPILAHSGTRAAWSRVENQGIDVVVIAKIARLLGSDYFQAGICGGYLVGTVEDFKRATEVLNKPMGRIKDTVPILSGGLHPGNFGKNLSVFGKDCLFLSGGGVLSHPDGIKAGVRAMKQAYEAYDNGVGIKEYAVSHPELETAIRKWGILK